jgi:hypothetical protein
MPELLLPRLKREIEARLAELRPIVDEVEHLEAAKRALLEDRPARAPRVVAAPPASRAVEARPERPVAPPSPPKPADPERDAIVTIVEERPGVSVAEIVAVTKLPKVKVAETVSKLKREGVFADEAGGVKLASRQPITLAKVSGDAPREESAADAEWEAARPTRAGALA